MEEKQLDPNQTQMDEGPLNRTSQGEIDVKEEPEPQGVPEPGPMMAAEEVSRTYLALVTFRFRFSPDGRRLTTTLGFVSRGR